MKHETTPPEREQTLDLTLPNAVGHYITRAGSVRYRMLRRFVQLACLAAYAVLFMAGLTLIGYVFDIPALFRPIPDGPATSPLTLVLVTLLACCQLLVRKRGKAPPLKAAMLYLAVALAVIRVSELTFFPADEPFSRFFDQFVPLTDTGAPPRTGANTAFAVLLIAVAFLTRRRLPKLGLMVAVTTPVPPLVALIGYGFRLDAFHGHMSLMTVLLLMPLCFGAVVNYAHFRLLRPMVCDTVLGRIARVQMGVSFILPLCLGMLIFRVPAAAQSTWTAIFVALMIWCFSALVVVSARAHDKTDQQRRRIERKLVALSMVDGLTGIVNRQGVADALPELDSSSLGLLLLDLDFFKQINDQYGHSVGDEVLKATGQALRARMRPEDMVARWGGEEFLVLVPNIARDDLQSLGEDLRRRIAAINVAKDMRLTASIGATVMNGALESFEEALGRADTGLYMAKSKGRNVLVMRDGPQLPNPKKRTDSPAIETRPH